MSQMRVPTLGEVLAFFAWADPKTAAVAADHAAGILRVRQGNPRPTDARLVGELPNQATGHRGAYTIPMQPDDLVGTPRHCGFTHHEGRLVKELLTDVGIGKSQALTDEEAGFQNYRAVWDTGATRTAISPKVVRECDLVSVERGRLSGVHGGVHAANLYLISVHLPNEVGIPNVRVVEMSQPDGEEDVIIGMDIIGLGYFTMTSFHDRTTFAFHMIIPG